MIMDEVLSRFVEGCPVAVMARLGLDHVLNQEWVNETFEKHREEQYTRELLFSTVVDTMGLVATGQRPSLNAAIQKNRDLTVSVTAFYDKVNHTEPTVVQALVQGSAERLAPVVVSLTPKLPPLLPGYRLRIIDGNHLPASEKRLGVLRDFRGAALPGHSLVVYEPELGLVTNLLPCEDAHAQERVLSNTLLAHAQPGELWMGDRNFCTRIAMVTVNGRDSFFIFREHATTNPTPVGRRRKIGRTDTGVVYEQAVEIPTEDGKRLLIRRIEIELDAPTTDGDKVIRLLTNLPAHIRAKKIANLYRRRWSIEGMFGKLEAALNSEIRTLGYPRAALLAFGCAVIAYNVLSLIETAIASVHDLRSEGIELSTYHIADEIKSTYRGMMLAVAAAAWAQLHTDNPNKFARTLQLIAKHVDPRTLRKRPRGPKPKKPKGYASSAAVHKHVATARVLRDGRIK
jgi:IS4 transposase